MATYDYIRIEWSNGCDIIDDDNIPIVYSEGFQNVLYFDENLSSPIYSIDDEGKKTKGTTKLEKQVWEKKYGIEIVCVEAVADILSTLPLHETVKIIDKDGTSYINKGADIEVEIVPAEFFVPVDEQYYPVMRATVTFTANLINKTACCSDFALVECSDVVPDLLGIAVGGPGKNVLSLSGTSPESTLIRVLWREYIDPVVVSASNVMDTVIISDVLAYCCTLEGKIYKSVNGGNTWVGVYAGASELRGIAWDFATEVYAVGELGAIVSGTITDDLFAPVASGVVENLNALAFEAVSHKGMIVGNAGTVLHIDNFGVITPRVSGTIANLFDVTIPYEDYFVACGGTDLVYSANWGAPCVVNTHPGKKFISIESPLDTGKYYIGAADGIYFSANAGIAISQLKTTPAIVSIAFREYVGDVRMYAMTNGGVIYYDDNAANTFASIYKQGTVSARRIAALTGEEEYLMVSLNTGEVGTTETPMNEGNAVTGTVFNIDGVAQTLMVNTTYEVALQTFIFSDDPCETSDTQLVNT